MLAGVSNPFLLIVSKNTNWQTVDVPPAIRVKINSGSCSNWVAGLIRSEKKLEYGVLLENLVELLGQEDYFEGKSLTISTVYLLAFTAEKNDLFYTRIEGSSLGLIHKVLLTQSQWGSSVSCSCGNRLLDQTKDRIAAPCFQSLGCRYLCG